MSSTNPNNTFQGVKKFNTYTSLSASKLYFNNRTFKAIPNADFTKLTQNYQGLNVYSGDTVDFASSKNIVFDGKKQVNFATQSSSS